MTTARPLQFQHIRSARVKSWQPMSNSWSTSCQPDLHALLVGEKQQEIARARFCIQSCSKVGQLLVKVGQLLVNRRGLPCSSSLATSEKKRRKNTETNISWDCPGISGGADPKNA